jgi:6 kDa early secretory antigenic target
MATDLSLTPENLHHAATALDAESRHLAEALAQLESRVRSLEANWDGAAKEAYAEAQRAWSAALADMTTILGRIARETQQTAEGFVADDERAADRFPHRA